MVIKMEKAKGNRIQRRRNFWGYLFILPNFLGFTLFMLVPIVMSLLFSFTNYDVISQMDFIGLENYVTLFQDDQFITALLNTLWFSVLTVPAGIVFALLLAVLFNRQVRGIGIFRTVVFIPVITSMVAVSLVWSMLYEDNAGLFNSLLKFLNLPPIHWLTDTNMAMISVAIMSIWKGLGYNMTIFLAGLQGVPHDLYEAATVDGANSVQKFFKITVPMIAPTTYFVSLMALIGSLQVFDQVYIMTSGGPVDATKTVAMYLYQYGFNFYKMGYASAAAYVLF
ncbi:MAG: sugar ABC transporter permease, partial [Oscillospiraceae bacterium]